MKFRHRASAIHWIVVASALWLGRYATLGILPWRGTPLWAPWFDQSRYFASATAFARLDFSPDRHWYPLAYPLLASPFVWLMPDDPFFLPDIALFLLTCRAFQHVAMRLGITVWPATFCFLAAALVDTKLAGAWAHPWTTTLSAALIWWLIERTCRVGDGAPAGSARGNLIAVGALAAALPLVRPADVLIGLTCVVVAVATLVHRKRFPLVASAWIGLGGLLVSGVYGGLHLAVYGPHPTRYMVAAAATGFIWSDIGWKAYVLLVHARPWYPDTQAILERLPWIVPGCAGLIVAAIGGAGQTRHTVLLIFAAMLPASMILLTYADLQPPGLWLFGNIHYFKWPMPAFAAGLLLGWRQICGSRDRGIFAAVLLALLLPLGIRIVPEAVADTVPARMLAFRGDTHRRWDEAYFADVAIADDRGRLTNIGDFHQVPDAQGERAIAISRLFAGRPRRSDPGETNVTQRQAQAPYARFGERLSYLGF